MEEKEIIVFGGSAGSVDVLLSILPKLPVKFPFPIVVVIHRKDMDDSVLESVMKSRCQLNVIEIEDKTFIKDGTIFLAPAGYHLLVENDYSFSLDLSEKINFSRPNIDVALESIVNIYKNRVIGILLSGGNEDGARGMKLIKDAGGLIMIQSPESSLVPVMPKSIESLVEPHNILSPDEICNFLLNKSLSCNKRVFK